jgi:hypothetical protein
MSVAIFLVKDSQVRTIEDMGGGCESFSYWFGSAVAICAVLQ